MSTNAAISADTMPSPISGDEFSAEEISILKGETPPEAVPQSTVPNNTAPEAANDDIDAEELAEIETEDPDQPRDEKGRFVPKSAYLRVKDEGKATSQKLAQVAAELIRLRERDAYKQELLNAATQRQQEPEQIERDISPEEDIFGAYKQLAAKLQKLEQGIGQRDQSNRAQIEAMQLQTAARTDLETYATKEPAFMEAYGYLVNQRDQELQALGVNDPGQRQNMIKGEARELMEGALRGGQSAAERIWKLAQARGFQAKPKGEPPIDPKAAEQIERINKGKEASATLRGAGGTGDVGQGLTLSKIADMDESTYFRTRDQYVAKHGVGAWKKLTGGM
jgi:hypothetical protein